MVGKMRSGGVWRVEEGGCLQVLWLVEVGLAKGNRGGFHDVAQSSNLLVPNETRAEQSIYQ